MLGAGAAVFAVWGYVIAITREGQVELNPIHVGALLGMTPESVTEAIAYLTAPDARSRSKADDGRRLVKEGEFAYRVPTWRAYRSVRNEEDRRAYNRQKQQEHRAKKRGVKAPVNDSQGSQQMSTLSAQSEATSPPEALKTTALVRLAPDGLQSVSDARTSRDSTEAIRRGQVEFIFAYWQRVMKHPNALLDRKRGKVIQSRLTENNGDAWELIFVIDGATKDPFLMGQRMDSTTKYDGIETLFRDRGQVERLAQLGGFNGKPHPLAERYPNLVPA